MDWLDVLKDMTDALSEWPRPASSRGPSRLAGVIELVCASCGRLTLFPKRPAGVARCASCSELAHSARPTPRECPVDGTILEAREAASVIIDRCPRCNGLWFDSGELEAIIRAAGDAARRDRQEAADLLSSVLVGVAAKK
jgi:hypothetical protein